jgi:hypothetical protein
MVEEVGPRSTNHVSPPGSRWICVATICLASFVSCTPVCEVGRDPFHERTSTLPGYRRGTPDHGRNRVEQGAVPVVFQAVVINRYAQFITLCSA